jgi:hypothetical protein
MVDQRRPLQRFPLIAAVVTDLRLVTIPLLTVLLLCPTILHGRPYLFWDTEQYFHYGEQLSAFATEKIAAFAANFIAKRVQTTSSGHSTDARETFDPGSPIEPETSEQTHIDQKSRAGGIALYGARSPFYSVWLYAVARILGLWGIVATQAAAVSWLVWRSAAHVARKHSFASATAMTALMTVGSSAWFFAGLVMPDVYAATALLSVALFFAYADQMSWLERFGAAALLAGSSVFHLTHLLTAMVVAAVGVALAFFWRSTLRASRRPAMLAVGSAVVVAITIQLSFDAAARVLLGTVPKRPPFLMARLIADGPGRLYLDKACQDKAFLLCRYRQRDFANADAFLWSGSPDTGLFSTLSVEQRLQLIDEEPRFAAAVLARYPIGVAKAVMANTIEQFVLIWPAEAWADPGAVFGDPIWRDKSFFQVAPFLNSCIAHLGSCVPIIPQLWIAVIVIAATLASFAVIAVHFITKVRNATGPLPVDRAYQRVMVFSVLIVAGLVVNAVACGAISGPHHRYQARIVWLVVLAASVLELSKPIMMTSLRKQWGHLKNWNKSDISILLRIPLRTRTCESGERTKDPRSN